MGETSHLAVGTPLAFPLPTLTLKEQPYRVGCRDLLPPEPLQGHPCCNENAGLCSLHPALHTSLSFPHLQSPQLHSRMGPGPSKAGRNSRHKKGARESRFLRMQGNCCRGDEWLLPPKSPIPKNWSRDGCTTRIKGLPDPHQVASFEEAQEAPWPEAPAPAHHFWGHSDTAQPRFPCPQRPQPHLPQSLQARKHSLPRALYSRQAETGTPGKGEILKSHPPTVLYTLTTELLGSWAGGCSTASPYPLSSGPASAGSASSCWLVSLLLSVPGGLVLPSPQLSSLSVRAGVSALSLWTIFISPGTVGGLLLSLRLLCTFPARVAAGWEQRWCLGRSCPHPRLSRASTPEHENCASPSISSARSLRMAARISLRSSYSPAARSCKRERPRKEAGSAPAQVPSQQSALAHGRSPVLSVPQRW